MTADVRDALARAHYEHEGGVIAWDDLPDLYRESWSLMVDHYVPTVSRLIDQGAADALNEAADVLTDRVRPWVTGLLRDRADALAPPATEPIHTEGQQA